MTPMKAADTPRWLRNMRDVLAQDMDARKGLTDDEALPLMDWGYEQARVAGERLAPLDDMDPDEEQVHATADALLDVMKRVNWLVLYRDKKDAGWVGRVFRKLNELGHTLYGPEAHTFTEEEIAAWYAEQPQRDNQAVIQDLLARLTPETPESPQQPYTQGEENE
jgi:broad specificity phosphatase PhoE